MRSCENQVISSASEGSWYAVSTRSRQEKVAAAALRSADVPTFLPLLTEVHSWSDRKKAVTVPLFPSYLFVQIPASSDLHVRVLKTPGVVGFVCNHSGPLAIPQQEIDGVRSVLSQRVDCSPYPFLRTGERVRIVGGALDGVEGILVGRGPKAKLVISIEVIQRTLAVSVYDLNVKPVVGPRGIAA
jgi:transcription antitermination factor NusG